MEDSFKNTFTSDGKKLSLGGVSEKWEKISSTSQKIILHKQELPSPYFKSFNKALNKEILFPPDRKSVSANRNEEFAKNYFYNQDYLTKWKKLFCTSQKKSFCWEQRSFSLKTWSSSFHNGFHQQKTLNRIILFQERILQLLFLLVETIIEIRKNQICKT